MTAVFATFRPSRGDIAVFVGDGPKQTATALGLDEARAIHGALGRALALADCAHDPVAAVQP